MVSALFEVVAGLNRAQRGNLPANRLAILHVIATYGKARPSVLAEELQVNQSSITRHIQILQDEGAVAVRGDPEDLRACVIRLTDAGQKQLRQLTRVGLERFSTFVAGWDADEVRTFTRLLRKFEESKLEVAAREKRPPRTRWRRQEPNR